MIPKGLGSTVPREPCLWAILLWKITRIRGSTEAGGKRQTLGGWCVQTRAWRSAQWGSKASRTRFHLEPQFIPGISRVFLCEWEARGAYVQYRQVTREGNWREISGNQIHTQYKACEERPRGSEGPSREERGLLPWDPGPTSSAVLWAVSHQRFMRNQAGRRTVGTWCPQLLILNFNPLQREDYYSSVRTEPGRAFSLRSLPYIKAQVDTRDVPAGSFIHTNSEMTVLQLAGQL